MEAGAGCVYPRTMGYDGGYDGDTETVTGFRMSLHIDGKYLTKPFRSQSVLRNQFSVPTGPPGTRNAQPMTQDDQGAA